MTTREQFEGVLSLTPGKITAPDETEYILVADTDGTIISSHSGQVGVEVLKEAQSLAKKIRAANGEVTIFKRTEY